MSLQLLAIETSTTCASIALTWQSKTYTLAENTLQRHAEWALEAVSSLLKTAGTTLAALDGIVFGAGPGSFTGIRIACSIAKGLAIGSGLPLYPVNGLQAIAHSSPSSLGLSAGSSSDFECREAVAVRREEASQCPHALVALDARMQAWYWGMFESGQALGEIVVTPAADIVVPGDGPVVLVGVGVETLLPQLPEGVRERVIRTEERYPTAAAMIEVVQAGGILPVTVEAAAPLYVRQQVVL